MYAKNICSQLCRRIAKLSFKAALFISTRSTSKKSTIRKNYSKKFLVFDTNLIENGERLDNKTYILQVKSLKNTVEVNLPAFEFDLSHKIG